MLDLLRSALAKLQSWLDFAPPTLVAIVVLGLAAVAALSVHNTLLRLLSRLLGARYPYMRTLLAQLHGVTRLGLLVLALVVVVPAVPLDRDTSIVVARLLLIALVILAGWAAMTAINLAADLYLMRFSLDTSDNLLARKHFTQVRVLVRTADTLVILLTIGFALMTFEAVRQYGVSLFASAGVAGLIVGFAARPVLSNLFAGVQLAITQPIRIDDAVMLENEFGNVEEITSTYVVVRLWDLRRMVVPLSYFIEKPFQNWTRDSSALVGVVIMHVDYSAPIERIREKVTEFAGQSKAWNGEVAKLQVNELRETTMELRVLVSANSAPQLSEIRFEMREKLIGFLQRDYPRALPRSRQEAIAGKEAVESQRVDRREP